jgi:hypothetical protein
VTLGGSVGLLLELRSWGRARTEHAAAAKVGEPGIVQVVLDSGSTPHAAREHR